MIQEAMFLATYNISTTQTISSCRGGVKCSLFFFSLIVVCNMAFICDCLK